MANTINYCRVFNDPFEGTTIMFLNASGEFIYPASIEENDFIKDFPMFDLEEYSEDFYGVFFKNNKRSVKITQDSDGRISSLAVTQVTTPTVTEVENEILKNTDWKII